MKARGFKMKNWMKNLCILLCVCITVLMVPSGAFAAGEEFEYECDLFNQTATLTAYNGWTATDIRIPATIERSGIQCRVTAIEPEVFQDKSSITSITIPETVTSIGERALKGCTGLTTITMPDGITEIKSETFRNCYNLKSITLPAELTTIGASAFSGCHVLESVTLPADLRSIGDNAFSDCRALTEVAIPRNTYSISNTAFMYCDKLAQITVHEDNYSFTSIDGVLFSEAYYTTKLVKYPQAKPGEEYVIPDGITSILPNAFYKVSALKKIDIPKSVVSVGGSAFENCGLTDVYYGGSSEQWRSISIASGNDTLSKAVRHNTYTVTLNANGGTVGSNLTFYIDGRIAPLPSDVTKSGFAFDGWYENPDFTDKRVEEISADSMGDRTFYAKWLVPYKYGIAGDTAAILSCNPAVTGKLQIPAMVGSVPVTKIETGAFKDCARLEAIELPQSIKTIAANAFLGCNALKDVYYNGSEEDWKTVAVESTGNDKLLEATKHFGFTVTLKTRGGYIGDGNVSSYISGTTTKLPTDVTRDGYFFEGWYAQPDCSGTPVTEIPANATGNKTFYAGWNDTYEFTVADNGNLTITGVIDPLALTGEVVIPETLAGRPVYSIGENAFEGCANITGITLLRRTSRVEANAFKDCTGMRTFTTLWTEFVTLLVDNTAFTGCTALTDIYYGGSVRTSYWNHPSLGEACPGWSNDRVTVHNPCWLKFESNGGEIGADAFRFYTPGVVKKLPADVTKEGYKFGGWYKDENFTGERQFEIPADMTGEGTYYAKWISSYHYTVDDDDRATITGVAFPDDFVGNVTLPSSVGGYPVVAIGDDAFRECEDMIRVTVPDGVVSISGSAFRECANLREISIPQAVTSIGESAFSHCRRLERITVDPQNANYRSDAGVLLTKDGTTLLCYPQKKSGDAFTIPATATKISKSAFENCINLKTITIPSSVTSIEGNAFGNCQNLSAIELVGENENYTVVNGVLYNKSGTTLICYPAGRTAARFEIPDGVTTIGNRAFYGCGALRGLSVPTSVTLIDSGAFEECGRMTDVYYGGDTAGWNRVEIRDANNPLMASVKHYTFPVTLHLDEGSVTGETPTSYLSGFATKLPSDVTRQGFSFRGWYDNEACVGTAVTEISADATGAKTFWAKWQAEITLPDAIEVTEFTDNTVTIESPIYYKTICVVLASYHEDVMTSCEVLEVPIKIGTQKVAAQSFNPAVGDEIHIMLWDGLSGMGPLNKPFKQTLAN